MARQSENIASAITAVKEIISAQGESLDAVKTALVSKGATDIEDHLINKEITEYSNSNIRSIAAYAFYYNTAITTANFPSVKSVGERSFANCTSLTTVSLLLATAIFGHVFDGCINLTTVNLPSLENIGSSAFINCTNLTAVILRNTKKVCTLANFLPFDGTPIASGTGYIYVPSALIEDYKVATNWTVFADQLRAIEDYPDICGGTE